MKIFERILDQRMRSHAIITSNQCGFVRGCGTIDAIHAIRLLMEKHREKNKPLHLAFLDLEKAFDRVPHDLIWHALRSHGIPEDYVAWTQMLYRSATSAVRCPAGTSPPFNITVGVHQGSALSPLLFILCMDTVTADLQTMHPWTLLYADDIALANQKRTALQRQLQQWNDRLSEYGLRLNTQKTEYLECRPRTNKTIEISGQKLQKVTQFKYLGSTVSADGDTMPDIRSRINAAWLKWRQTTGVLCDKKIPDWLKAKVYKTVVRPVALYGAECWATTRKHEQTINTMEMKMLRWMLGLTLLDCVPNDDIRQKLNIIGIVKKIREARLRWYGHVMRHEETSVAKTALNLEIKGRRPCGRPKKRWMDAVTEDMRATNLTPGDAQNQGLWKRQ